MNKEKAERVLKKAVGKSIDRIIRGKESRSR